MNCFCSRFSLRLVFPVSCREHHSGLSSVVDRLSGLCAVFAQSPRLSDLAATMVSCTEDVDSSLGSSHLKLLQCSNTHSCLHLIDCKQVNDKEASFGCNCG